MSERKVVTPFYVLHSSDSPVHHVVFSSDGAELLASTKDGELVVWDLSIMRVKLRYKVCSNFEHEIKLILLSTRFGGK